MSDESTTTGADEADRMAASTPNNTTGNQLEKTVLSPLPPASELAELEALLPGAIERAFTMAEVEQQNAIETQRMETQANADAVRAEAFVKRTTVETTRDAVKRAQWMSFVFLVGLEGGAVYAVHEGQPYAAGVLAMTGVGGVLAALYGVTRRGARTV